MLNEQGEQLNSKLEWNQPKIIRTIINNGGSELASGRTPSWLEGQGPKGGLEKRPHPAQGLEKWWNQQELNVVEV